RSSSPWVIPPCMGLVVTRTLRRDGGPCSGPPHCRVRYACPPTSRTGRGPGRPEASRNRISTLDGAGWALHGEHALLRSRGVAGHAPLAMTRFVIDPGDSQVWIEGSSSVHPVHATASGLEGWVELSFAGANLRKDTEARGEVRIAVDGLRSGNALVDRETRRRIDARRFPEIVGTVTSSRR